MAKISTTYEDFKKWVANIPFKTYVTVLLEGVGLFANLIAIAAFFGANNTPKESSNFYINNQEFLVWSLIAGVYTLGLLSARFKRRWRGMLAKEGYEEDDSDYTAYFPFRSAYHRAMFRREFSFTIATTFPLIYLYIRALDVAYTEGLASPWITLGETALACIPVTFGIMISSAIFDKALSLYSGD
jgi:hypothetical protein